jgi:hypothetical protein
MTDPFDFGPVRELPDHVRADARRRIAGGMAPRRSNGLAPIAIASVVVMLAAGAVALTAFDRAIGSDPVAASASRSVDDPNRPGNRFVSPEEKFSVLEHKAPADATVRCMAAEPGAERWEPLFTASARGVSVTAFFTPGGKRFCELTPATVTLSAVQPDSPAGTAQATFVSSFGTVAGVVDPAFGTLSVGPQGSEAREIALLRNGIFVSPNAMSLPDKGLTFYLGGSPDVQGGTRAANAPAASTATTDRPQPAGDRNSESGQRLSACFRDAAGPPPVDVDAWEPADSRELGGGESLQLGRYGNLLAICTFTSDNVFLKIDEESDSNGYRTLEAEKNPYLFTSTVFYDFRGHANGSSSSETVAVTGLVKSADVASVSISRPESPSVVATVHKGTFVLPGIELNEGTPAERQHTVLTAFDVSGIVLARIALKI